jgi:hypothetical protein
VGRPWWPCSSSVPSGARHRAPLRGWAASAFASGEFDPTLAPGSRLVEVGGIETPSGSGGLHIRDDEGTGLTDLLIIERDSGVRIIRR